MWSELINHVKRSYKQLEVVSYIPNNGEWLNENHVSIWRGKTVWCINIQMPWRERNVSSIIYLFIFISFWYQCIFASIILWSIINNWLLFLLSITLKTLINMTWVNKPSQKVLLSSWKLLVIFQIMANGWMRTMCHFGEVRQFDILISKCLDEKEMSPQWFIYLFLNHFASSVFLPQLFCGQL